MVLEAITAMLNDLNQSQKLILCLLSAFVLFSCWKKYLQIVTPVTTTTTTQPSGTENQWIDKGFGLGYGDMNPAQRLSDLIQEFGPPSVFDGSSGGSAIWYKRDLENTPFERVEIRDEQIPHDKPVKHTDFLYSWHKVDVPTHLIGGIHKISSSITYDPLKKVSRARCHDMRPNVVTHWIVKKYAHEEITLDEAVGMYGPMITELFENDSQGTKYRQLMSEL